MGPGTRQLHVHRRFGTARVRRCRGLARNDVALATAHGILICHWEGEQEGDYRRAQLGSYLRLHAAAPGAC